MNNDGSYICECDIGYIEGISNGSTDEYCTEGDCPGSCLDLDECDSRVHQVAFTGSSILHQAPKNDMMFLSVKNFQFAKILTAAMCAIVKVGIS